MKQNEESKPVICGTHSRNKCRASEVLAMGDVIWQPFNYDGLLDAGAYWFVIEGPMWDCDDDGSGRLVGVVIGSNRRRVLLGYLTWDHAETSMPTVEACDTWEDQGLQDNETVTHWAVIQKPAFPEVPHG